MIATFADAIKPKDIQDYLGNFSKDQIIYLPKTIANTYGDDKSSPYIMDCNGKIKAKVFFVNVKNNWMSVELYRKNGIPELFNLDVTRLNVCMRNNLIA